VTRIRENLDVICSDLTTYVAEERLKRESSPQTVFEYAFAEVDDKYDVVLFDTAPEISRLQVAAFCYTHRVMVPVTLDVLGLMGACSAVFSAQALRWVYSTAIEMIGFLPTMVQRGVPETEAMLKTLAAISKKAKIEVLPSIEYDDAVLLATRGQQFVADYSATSSAAMSFELLAKKFMALEELQRKQ
jgi:cellulose biosynthesis protein BcsQ